MIFFGLGNPGRKYERTRHNLGFMVLDELAGTFGVRFRAARDWQHAAIQVSGTRCDLVKPQRYMNCSGVVVKEYLERMRNAAGQSRRSEFFVMFDDIDLPLGRMRIRTRGSDGGHQGMANIIFHLGTTEFARVRMGIGLKPEGADAAAYVLSRFTKEQERYLPDVVSAGRDALVMIAEQGINKAMNRFNSMQLAPEQE